MEVKLEGQGAYGRRAVRFVEKGNAVKRLDLELWVHDKFLVEGFIHHRHVEGSVLVLGQHVLSPRAASARLLAGPLPQQESVETVDRQQHHGERNYCVTET